MAPGPYGVLTTLIPVPLLNLVNNAVFWIHTIVMLMVEVISMDCLTKCKSTIGCSVIKRSKRSTTQAVMAYARFSVVIWMVMMISTEKI